jgi:hypothetical protein
VRRASWPRRLVSRRLGRHGHRRVAATPRRRARRGLSTGRAARRALAPSQTGPADWLRPVVAPGSARRPSCGSSAPRVRRCRGARISHEACVPQRYARLPGLHSVFPRGPAPGSPPQPPGRLPRWSRASPRPSRRRPAPDVQHAVPRPLVCHRPSVTRPPLVGNDARCQSVVAGQRRTVPLGGAGRGYAGARGILALRLGPPRQTMRCWLCHAHRRRPGPPPWRPRARRAAAAGLR